MSAALSTIRKARKVHRCSKCEGRIQPGELYVDSRLPPGGEMGNTAWWRLPSHVGAYPDEQLARVLPASRPFAELMLAARPVTR